MRERPPAAVALPLHKVDALIFGLRTIDQVKGQVREWGAKVEALELLQVVQGRDTFALHLEHVD